MSEDFSLILQLEDARTTFLPGEMIRGAAAWSCGSVPLSAIVRIGWNTAGKGTVNSQVIETISLPVSAAREQVPFELRAPLEPYSFSGKLISLIWAVELLIEPGRQLARTEIVISPSMREIGLAKELPTS